MIENFKKAYVANACVSYSLCLLYLLLFRLQVIFATTQNQLVASQMWASVHAGASTLIKFGLLSGSVGHQGQ